MTESATLTELAEERAGAAERKLAATEAKLGVAQNERDVAVKTAEAADAINQRLVDRIEEVSKEAGRLEGVNAVLKEKIQEPPQPIRTPDKEPIVEVTHRRGGWGWIFWLILGILFFLALLLYAREPIIDWFDSLFTPHKSIETKVVDNDDKRITTLEVETGDLNTRVSKLETASSELDTRLSKLESAQPEVVPEPTACTLPGSVYIVDVGCVFPLTDNE